MTEKTFRVNGMTCMDCVKRIENALLELNGVKEAKVNLLESTVYTAFEEDIVSEMLLRTIIEDEGYTVMP